MWLQVFFSSFANKKWKIYPLNLNFDKIVTFRLKNYEIVSLICLNSNLMSYKLDILL